MMIISGIEGFNAFITRIAESRHCTGDMRGAAHNLNGIIHYQCCSLVEVSRL